MHEMIRILHFDASLMVFNLLCELGGQAGVLKLMENAQF